MVVTVVFVCVCAQENPDPRKFATWLATRPPKFERDAAHMLIDVLLDEHIPHTDGFFLHIAHLGDAGNIDGFNVSGEVVCMERGRQEQQVMSCLGYIHHHTVRRLCFVPGASAMWFRTKNQSNAVNHTHGSLLMLPLVCCCALLPSVATPFLSLSGCQETPPSER